MKQKIFSIENIIRIISSILLFISLTMDWYDFDNYQIILRWITFSITGYAVFKYYKKIEDGWLWTFGVIALFFNPIFQVEVSRDFQKIINILVGIFLTFSTFLTTYKDKWKENFKLFFKSSKENNKSQIQRTSEDFIHKQNSIKQKRELWWIGFIMYAYVLGVIRTEISNEYYGNNFSLGYTFGTAIAFLFIPGLIAFILKWVKKRSAKLSEIIIYYSLITVIFFLTIYGESIYSSKEIALNNNKENKLYNDYDKYTQMKKLLDSLPSLTKVFYKPKIKILYENLTNPNLSDFPKNYSLPEYDKFVEDMKISKNRRRLYHNAKRFIKLPDFEQFEKELTSNN